MSKPKYWFGRELKFSSALMPRTSASAVARGSVRRPGKLAYTVSLAILVFVVQGISSSFCFIVVTDTWAVMVLWPGIL